VLTCAYLSLETSYLLVRAYLVYVRPIVEYNSPPPYHMATIGPNVNKDRPIQAKAIEKVQRRFKRAGLRQCSYEERLCRLQLHSLELRRLLIDLAWCYKILFEHVHLYRVRNLFQLNMRPSARGHIGLTCAKNYVHLACERHF